MVNGKNQGIWCLEDSELFTIYHLLFTFNFPFTIHCLLSCCERIMRPARRVTRDRGARRSDSTIRKFVQPEMMWLLPRPSALSAVSTTSSGLCERRAGGL